MAGSAREDRAKLGYRILNWIGIVEQLARTKANRTLAELGLPWPQFVLLNHFSHRPDEGKMVTEVARAMQQNQPGISKTVKAMVESGILEVVADDRDRRVKRLFLTPQGRATHAEALARLAPMVADSFAGWSTEEMAEAFQALDRLKVYLDDNR